MRPVENPLNTQRRQVTLGIEAELEAEGFDDAVAIGHGGFGTVYRCTERALDRFVAIKVLPTGSGTAEVERFLREQRTMGKLSGHPAIVTILHADITANGRLYLVMPYCARGSLHDAIERSGPLSVPGVVRLGVKLAGALETAHRHGILHRDVKPGNILFTDYGEPQLCDFGIAHVTGGFETGTGEVTGSPAFTAPEVLAGHASTVQSDIYSLGATLFTAVSGHAAFERLEGEDVVAQFVRIGREAPAPLPEVPARVATLIAAAMARSRADRPASASEFGRSLRELEYDLGLPVDDFEFTAEDAAPPGPGIGGSSGPLPSRRHHSALLPTPATRFRPPRPPNTLVSRPRLIDVARLPERKRLTLIHAPAGFGKSSVATQLAERLHHDGVRVAWLTADLDDNNAVTFCAHLLQALQRAQPELGTELPLALEEGGSRAEQFVLTCLINDIHEHKQQMALVVEDWHLVTSTAAQAAMRFLLDNGCHHLQWIVTSRGTSGLPLGTLRVHDELIEIDTVALRFTAQEATALLERYDEIDIAADDVAQLTTATEGWAAGLQLAGLSLRHRADPAALFEQLSGRDQAIGEFLTENVLAPLDPDMVEFMMTTATPRRICAGLANALTGDEHGQARLEQVEQRHLFLRRIDAEGRWFRYFQLFAEFLRQRMERERPHRVPDLHRVAARWFAEHDMVTDAVAHALSAGDPDWAAELVENIGIALLEQGQIASLLALAESVPAGAAIARPRLQLQIALANLALRKESEARAALDRIHSMLAAVPEDAPQAWSLRAHCQIIESVAAMFADRTDGVEELIAPALADPDRFDPWYTGGAAVVASFLALARSDYAAARACRERAAGYLENAQGPFTETYAYCLSGIAAHEQLDIRAAEYYLRKAYRVAMRGRKTPGIPARLAGALLADLLYERNELDEAESLLDAAYEWGATAGAVDFMIATYVTGAKIKSARGDAAAARTRLETGMRLAEDLSLPRLAASITGERIRLGLTDIPEQGSPTAELTRDIHRGNAIRRALETPGTQPPPIAEAEALIRTLTERGRARALLTAEILLARCLWAAGRPDPALRTMRRVIRQCHELGLMRPIRDEDVAPILAALSPDT